LSRNPADDVQTIFTALRDAQKGRREREKLRRVVWLTSYRKILKRFGKDDKFFKKGIRVILRDWVPAPGEIISPEYFEIDRELDDIFQHWQIPHLPGKGGRKKYLLSDETVRQWGTLITVFLGRFSEASSEWKELPQRERCGESALTLPVFAYELLYRFLYRTEKALDIIFTQTSLGRHLLDQSKLKAEPEGLDPQLLQSVSE
jgi:hypothetical protein